jgi:hypothetical protein
MNALRALLVHLPIAHINASKKVQFGFRVYLSDLIYGSGY